MRPKIQEALTICVLVVSLIITPVAAQENDCEKLAKDFQKVYGGDLILVQPLKENGAWDFGAYNGHWINKVWSKESGYYYYDPQERLQTNLLGIKTYFESKWNKTVKVLDYNKGEIPFGIIWHY